MDHIQFIKNHILTESQTSQVHRDAIHPHASGALLCPRRNIMQWIELVQARTPEMLSEYLINDIKTAVEPEPEVPGVFTVGHLFDRWLKSIYEGDVAHPEWQAESGRPRIFNLPFTEEAANTGTGGAIPIAGEYDMLVRHGGDAPITDLIDFKTCKSLYMYEKKGPSMHHIAQLSVYAYGLMVDRFDTLIIKPEHIKAFKRDTRLILLYVEKNAAQMMAFHVDLFPLGSLRSYYKTLDEFMRLIKAKAVVHRSPIEREHLPPAVPSFDWECKWKTGSCKYYETFCKEEQNELRGTVARAQARTRDDRLSPETGGDSDTTE